MTGVQLVGSVGHKIGLDEGVTLKSSVGVAAGGAIQVGGSISERGGEALRLQVQYNVTRGAGLGASAAPLAIGYTWRWETTE